VRTEASSIATPASDEPPKRHRRVRAVAFLVAAAVLIILAGENHHGDRNGFTLLAARHSERSRLASRLGLRCYNRHPYVVALLVVIHLTTKAVCSAHSERIRPCPQLLGDDMGAPARHLYAFKRQPVRMIQVAAASDTAKNASVTEKLMPTCISALSKKLQRKPLIR